MSENHTIAKPDEIKIGSIIGSILNLPLKDGETPHIAFKSEVTEIVFRGTSVKGKRYIGLRQKLGDNAVMFHSFNEDDKHIVIFKEE